MGSTEVKRIKTWIIFKYGNFFYKYLMEVSLRFMCTLSGRRDLFSRAQIHTKKSIKLKKNSKVMRNLNSQKV